VVSGEFCEESPSGEVAVKADAGKGRNILRAGSEVKSGAVIVKEGSKLTPGYLGLAAAAGINRIGVYQRPRVAMIGIGDEVTWLPWAPGCPILILPLYLR
jgi:molybdopterin molybdotransferase